jgi:predicted ATPase
VSKTPPLVGREQELELLRASLAQAREGHETRSLTVVGEAGIGKSRLISEFDDWLSGVAGDVETFRGRAHASSQHVPFSLMRDVLAEHAGIHDSDPPDTVGEKLQQDVVALLGDERAVTKTELIARLLGFEIGEAEDLGGVDPQHLNESARAFVQEYFRAAGTPAPAVLLCEDLHWADGASLDMIPLVASLPDAAVLVVGSARPSLLERRPEWGEGLRGHLIVELGPLTTQAGEALLVESLGGDRSVPGQLRHVVLTTAEGNPFYIEELIKMLVEDGVVFQAEGGWQLRDEDLAGLRVPPTLTGVLQARFDTLEPEERRCLQHGSVIGRVFWDKAVDSLTAAEGGSPAGQSTATAPILDQLRTREMVFRHDPSTFDDTEEYLFKHALLRDVTYSTLLKRQRRVYHGLAARWLEGVTGRARREGEFSRVIADHYLSADEPSRAADWYLRAGKVAAAQFANQAALEAFARALDLRPDASPRWRAEVLLEREEVNELLGDRERQRLDLDAAQAIADEIGDGHLGASVVSPHGLGTVLHRRGAGATPCRARRPVRAAVQCAIGWPHSANELATSYLATGRPRIRQRALNVS